MGFAIPLCPPDQIEEAFALMRAEVVDVFSYAEEFIAYIRSTYMNGAFGNEDDGWEWNAFERVEDGF